MPLVRSKPLLQKTESTFSCILQIYPSPFHVPARFLFFVPAITLPITGLISEILRCFSSLMAQFAFLIFGLKIFYKRVVKRNATC